MVRRTAVRLHEQGIAPEEIAEAVDRGVRAIYKWIAAYREGGEAAIAAKPHCGARPKLSDEQRENLREQLLDGAQHHGFKTDLWNSPRIRELIRREYGVDYHVNYIPELLKAINFSLQKPERRAREQNAEAVEEWRRRDWERIKKRRNG